MGSAVQEDLPEYRGLSNVFDGWQGIIGYRIRSSRPKADDELEHEVQLNPTAERQLKRYRFSEVTVPGSSRCPTNGLLDRPARSDFSSGLGGFLLPAMILLLDVGNTHVHCGWADQSRVTRSIDFPTAAWREKVPDSAALKSFMGRRKPQGAYLCSVVPAVTLSAQSVLKELFGIRAEQLSPENLIGVGIDYPAPSTIGQDRLANAVAAKQHFGAPVVVVDFGTAVTFDVVNGDGNYAGGIIAPGMAVMTDYLHEKTALLPRIKIREPKSVIGRSTEEAMLVGAVHGYRGLVRELIRELKKELRAPKLPVVATGGYAAFLAKGLSEITKVCPGLTLEGLRLLYYKLK